MRIIKIGKESTNDIYINFKSDPTVSRYHCQIFVDDEGNKFLTDLNSTNGTFVNNNKISEPVMLNRYDIVRAGNSLVNWKEFLKNSKDVSNGLDQLNSNVDDSGAYKKSESSSKKIKKKWGIIIVVILSILFIIQYNRDKESETPLNNSVREAAEEVRSEKLTTDDDIIDYTKDPRPKNGYSPYDEYFGKGIYDNTTGNVFVIKNSNSSDAVVLLVDANSKKKIRNEYVRKGVDFEMTGVPDGTYYIEWFSGNDWSSNLKVGSIYKGGFLTDASFTKTRDESDWMEVKGYFRWTITLYNVSGGDVASKKINANDFFN